MKLRYNRWSEAPVITMAAAMFLKKAEIQFFNSIGYMYGDVSHCPFSLNTYQQCMCDIRSSFDFHTASCTPSLLDYLDDDESMYEITDFLRYLFLDPALAHAEHIEPLSD
ncbi:nucleotide-diphospho-sugar transferase [Radiomyces spectabilis]|uniref:nucleotide-diphospho-sugar transferase n=1 Tax=Radiomyces spectabilis TaxID=64574 RepID=UPI00221E53AA|nr:nucleotide-diphospho-sugar transferase [Radiomyces spectabilis]KAI8374304.1 nucleotide-diphospho-sugar transferase [Radiomyces spectabilis]